MDQSDNDDLDAHDYLPTAAWPTLRARAQLLKKLRAFFDDRDFCEVETPLLSAESVIDQHLDPFPVTVFGLPENPEVGTTYWLQTSPEFGMKRLLVAGAETDLSGYARLSRRRSRRLAQS